MLSTHVLDSRLSHLVAHRIRDSRAQVGQRARGPSFKTMQRLINCFVIKEKEMTNSG